MDKQQRLGFCLVFLGAVTLASKATAEVKKVCPPGQRPTVDGCIEGSRHARIRTVGVEEARTQSVPSPDVNFEVDPARHKRLDAARKILLVRELQQLEGVLAATPRNAPDRPSIIRRLAEGYVELEAISERERVEHELLAEAAKRAAQASSTSAKDTAPSQPTRAAPKRRPRPTVL